MSEFREDINTKKADQETCKKVRDADLKALARRVSGTISELGQVLGAADGRWESFGLNIPAHPTVPEPVTAVTLTPSGPGRLLAEWPHARRATRYLAWIQITGTDPAPRLVDDTRELEFLFKDLPTGATVKVQIAAGNPAGEAALSPVATAVVG